MLPGRVRDDQYCQRNASVFMFATVLVGSVDSLHLQLSCALCTSTPQLPHCKLTWGCVASASLLSVIQQHLPARAGDTLRNCQTSVTISTACSVQLYSDDTNVFFK
jgi:hypothetical protein